MLFISLTFLGSTVWEKKMVGKELPSSSSSSSSSFLSTLGGALLWGTEVQLGFRLSPFTAGAASPSFSSSEEKDDVSSPFMSALSDNLGENISKEAFGSLPEVRKCAIIKVTKKTPRVCSSTCPAHLVAPPVFPVHPIEPTTPPQSRCLFCSLHLRPVLHSPHPPLLDPTRRPTWA